MKRLLLIPVLLMTMTAGAVPLSLPLTPRTFGVVENNCPTNLPCGDPFSYMSTLTQGRAAAAQRLDEALDELRSKDPVGFDLVMRAHGLIHVDGAVQ